MTLPKPYFEDDAVTIYHGDCRELLPLMPKVDLVLTDPPYGINLGAQASNRTNRGLEKPAYSQYDDSPENFKAVVVPAIRVALDRAERGMVFMGSTSMWDLPRPSGVSAIYQPAAIGRMSWGFQNLCHIMLYGVAPDMNKGHKNTSLFSTDTAERNGHPVPKPLSWLRWAVALGSRSNETILDPFMGSGTTLRAAKDLGRKAIGIEIEERYCEIAAKRMAQGVLL